MESFKLNHKGYAVVEATICFPLVIGLFTALILLSLYLPQKSLLQYAAQKTANTIAVDLSDTWVTLPEGSTTLSRILVDEIMEKREEFSLDDRQKAENLLLTLGYNSLSWEIEKISVDCRVLEDIFGKDVQVTVYANYVTPVDLSWLGFSRIIPLTISANAVVNDGDDFVRQMDFFVDLVKDGGFLVEKEN